MRAGDANAGEELSNLIYAELRRRAHDMIGGEKRDAIVTTRGLVNEAYLRLAGNLPEIQDRQHLLSLVTKKMREILIDWARGRSAARRDADVSPLGSANLRKADAHQLKGKHGLTPAEILEIDQGLSRLAEKSPEWAALLELRYFGGLTIEEAAAHLGLSRSTAHRSEVRAMAELAKILG